MDYDVCIIGAGWAGFNAALKASYLKKKVCVAECGEIGGTCLNRGCIPTKSFVYNSQSGTSFADIARLKNETVARLRSGMDYLIKSKKIDCFNGKAIIKKDGSVAIGQDKVVKPKYVLIATGSRPKELPSLKFDHNKIISSDDALSLEAVPNKLLIVGGGAIGCEFASIFKRLGSDVTIIEMMQQLLPGVDSQTAKKLQSIFQKSGIKVILGADAVSSDGYDKVLVAVGRTPVIESIWDDSLSIKTEKGAICVDRELKTNKANIFAAGDCIGGYMLAHIASYEGELAVNNMFLKPQKRDYTVVPSSVFTSPEVSSIGLSEDEARNFGADFKTVIVHFLSIGMAHVKKSTDGFAKVVLEKKTGRVLGASIIGSEASELINSFSIIIKNKITAFDLRNTIFAHPSISEILGEVAKVFEYDSV